MDLREVGDRQPFQNIIIRILNHEHFPHCTSTFNRNNVMEHLYRQLYSYHKWEGVVLYFILFLKINYCICASMVHFNSCSIFMNISTSTIYEKEDIPLWIVILFNTTCMMVEKKPKFKKNSLYIYVQPCFVPILIVLTHMYIWGSFNSCTTPCKNDIINNKDCL